MPAITKRIVDATAPGAKNTFLWDGGLKGFGLKVTPAGAKVYILQYRTGGRGTPTKRVTIGRHGDPWTPDQARARARAIIGAVASGGDPAAEKRATKEARKRQHDGSRSLEAIATRWFSDMRRNGKRSAPEVERSFRRHVYPELGARLIEAIAKADAHQLYERLADAGKAPMGHQLCRNLKACLSFAVERELIPVNPLLRIKLPRLEERKRVLIRFHPEGEDDPAELLAVWRAFDRLPLLQRAFTKVLTLTLAREDEVAQMPWVELDGGLWRLPAHRHKGKRGCDIPLPTQAAELIEAMPRVSDHVFAGRGGRPIGDFSKLKAEVNRLSGVADWRWHDLRRTGSSWIEEAFGAEIMHAALGHSMGDRLTKTYAQGAGYRRKKAALQAWADFVTGSATARQDIGNVVSLTGRR